MPKKILCFLIFFAFLPFLHAETEEHRIDPVSIEGKDYYPLYRILNILKLERDYDLYTQRIIIKDKGRYLTFFVNEETVYHERNNILLKDPPLRLRGVVYIPREMVDLITDWKRGDYTFAFREEGFLLKQKEEIVYKKQEDPEPVKEKTDGPDANKSPALPAGGIFRETRPGAGGATGRIGFIVLDPGHGGHDPGAIGQKGLREKEVVLKVGLYMKEILSKRLDRVKIVMTRQKDEFISLQERAKIANRLVSKDLSGIFLSIHANASLNKKARGTETFVLSPTASDDEARAVAAMENGVIETRKEETSLNRILTRMLSYEYIRESIQLSAFIQQGYAQELKAPVHNKAIKKARFIVLEETFMPAVLTEIGFITNREEEKKLRTEAYQRKVAEVIADGVCKFIAWYEAHNGFIQ